MATTLQQQAASRTGVAPARLQLDSLGGIAIAHLNEQLTALAGRMVSALLDVDDPALDAHTVYHRVKSGNLLKSNSYAFIHLASAALEQGVRREIDVLAPTRKQLLDRAADALALVPMEEMDRSVAFGGISRPFEAACAELLATLNVRLGYLLGRDTLRLAQNPFRPDVILIALNRAWAEFEPDAEAHGLMAPLLRPLVLFDFAPLYETLNRSLAAAKGESDALRIRKTDNAARARAERASGKAALAQQLRQFFSDDAASGAANDTGIPLIPELPAMPQGSGGWRPSGAAGFHHGSPAPVFHASAVPAAPVNGAMTHGAAAHGGFAQSAPAQAAPPVLLDLLSRIANDLPQQPVADAGGGAAGNVFYLPRLKASLPRGSLSRGDESTIDLLTRIFETVYIDENIPKETRELIQFLQVPVLKAALMDKEFFFQEQHPARRMIDLMSRMGWEQRSGADDPLFQAMRRGVDRVGRDDGAGFADAVAELEASLESEQGVAAAEISAPIAAALKQEKVSAATRSARNAVALRVGGGDVVAVVETFLEKKWTSVLTIAYSVEPGKPGAVNNATRTMDDLIWSVKPKITQEQRKHLIARLPTLLATLNKWLDIIKWQDADRLQFFAELAECHASIVRAPIVLSPERQLEIALEVAQQDAQRRLEKEQALAAALDAEAAQAQADPALAAIEALERGMWLEFAAPEGSVQTVKLAWISPLRSLFIFSTAARKEAFSLSIEKLADAWRDGGVKVVRQDGVVARALAEAMAVNEPLALPAASFG